jgi:hypothetical protein
LPGEGHADMSEPIAADIEGLLRQAFRPVEPPESLAARLESTLQELTELAAEELESWELGSMRDPRNWVRPVVAVAVGTAAGAGLVILRVRSQHNKQRKHVQGVELAQRTMRAARDEVKRVLPKR